MKSHHLKTSERNLKRQFANTMKQIFELSRIQSNRVNQQCKMRLRMMPTRNLNSLRRKQRLKRHKTNLKFCQTTNKNHKLLKIKQIKRVAKTLSQMLKLQFKMKIRTRTQIKKMKNPLKSCGTEMNICFSWLY